MEHLTHSGASQRWIRFLWSSCFVWNKPAFQGQQRFYVLLFDETKWTTSKRPCSLSLGLHFSFTFICKLTQYAGSLWSQKVRDCLIFRPWKMADSSLSVPSKARSSLIAASLKECVASGDKPNKSKRMSPLFPSIYPAFSVFTVDRASQHGSGIISQCPLAWRENNVCVGVTVLISQITCLKDVPGRILGYFIREHMPAGMVSNYFFYICMHCSFTLLGCGSFVLV